MVTNESKLQLSTTTFIGNFPLESIKWFVSNSQIAPIGEMIIEKKITLQPELNLLSSEKYVFVVE